MTFPYRYAAIISLLAVTACENTPFEASPQALVLKGDPKACTHPDTRSLVEQVVRGSNRREVSADEIANIPISFGSTLMSGAQVGVNVSCSTSLRIGDSQPLQFAYIAVPSADNERDVGIQWLDGRNNDAYTYAYSRARSDWERNRREPIAFDDRSAGAIRADAETISSVVRTPSPAPPRPAPPRPTRAPAPPSLSDVPDRPSASVPSSGDSAKPIGPTRNPTWARPPSPEYPEAAVGRNITGRVQLRCTVRATGQLTDCDVLHESPRGYGFAENTIAAARRARISPALRDGTPVDGLVNFNVSFAPED